MPRKIGEPGESGQQEAEGLTNEQFAEKFNKEAEERRVAWEASPEGKAEMEAEKEALELAEKLKNAIAEFREKLKKGETLRGLVVDTEGGIDSDSDMEPLWEVFEQIDKEGDGTMVLENNSFYGKRGDSFRPNVNRKVYMKHGKGGVVTVDTWTMSEANGSFGDMVSKNKYDRRTGTDPKRLVRTLKSIAGGVKAIRIEREEKV